MERGSGWAVTKDSKVLCSQSRSIPASSGRRKAKSASRTMSKIGKTSHPALNSVAQRNAFDSLDLSSYKVVFSSTLLRRLVQENSHQKHDGRGHVRFSKLENGKRAASEASVTRGVKPPSILSSPAKKSLLASATKRTDGTMNNERPYAEEDIQRLVRQTGPSRTADQEGRIVTRPHDHDVLIGPGNANHPGNMVYRLLIWNFRAAYSQTERPKVAAEVEHIIAQILARRPPGRFLERNDRGHFVDAPRSCVRDKLGISLRDTRPTCFVLSEKLQAFLKGRNPRKLSPSTMEQNHRPVKLKSQHSLLPPSVTPPSVSSIDSGIGPHSRLAIFWPLDDTYYNATVLERTQNFVSLRYDDQDTEWLDLTKHKYNVLPPPDDRVAAGAAVAAYISTARVEQRATVTMSS